MSKLKVAVEDKAHAAACKKILCGAYPDLQTKNGYRLYKWVQTWFDQLDWKVIKFWVVKRDALGYKRGQKILNPKEMKKFVANGGKVRDIFTYPKQTRKAMRELMPILDVPIHGQKGFTAGKSIFDVAKPIAQGIDSIGGLTCMDLEDAFNQITRDQVACIFKYVFDLNKVDTERLATACCSEGHLFQGNPIAPLLFNIWSSRLIYVMHLCNIEVLQYADDLTIISEYDYISRHSLSFIHDLTRQLGFKVNETKTERQRKRHRFKFLGLYMVLYEDYGGYGIYPQNLRATKRNLRLWNYLENQGFKTTKRLNREGKPIPIREMKEGLNNWLVQCQAQSGRTGLFSYALFA